MSWSLTHNEKQIQGEKANNRANKPNSTWFHTGWLWPLQQFCLEFRLENYLWVFILPRFPGTLVRRSKFERQKLRCIDLWSNSLSSTWPYFGILDSLPQFCLSKPVWYLGFICLSSSVGLFCHSSQFLQKDSRIRNSNLGPKAACLALGFRPPGIWRRKKKE